MLEHGESIHEKTGSDTRAGLQALANRYIADNPAEPFQLRFFNREGIGRVHDFRYDFNLTDRFPDVEDGQTSYAWGMVWSDVPGTEMIWHVTAFGPMEVFVNGISIYRSLPHEERPKVTRNCQAVLTSGWNHIVLRFTKTRAGFGGRFGTSNTKWVIFNSMIGSMERFGQEGWLFSMPRTEPASQKAELPQAGQSESVGDFEWFPRSDWTEDERSLRPLVRLFGSGENVSAYAWTTFKTTSVGDRRHSLQGYAFGRTSVFIDGHEVYVSDRPGEFDITLELSYGKHQLIVHDSASPSWGTSVSVTKGDQIIPFQSPLPVKGFSGEWLYLGPFEEEEVPSIREIADLHRAYGKGSKGKYWRADSPGLWVRPYLEAPLFGKWNYPVGVTLYGILETGRMLGRGDLSRYAEAHVRQSSAWFAYTQWDTQQYGAPGINQSIAHIDSLDDCGSFGSTMLEVFRDRPLPPDVEDLAQKIGTYMSTIQERLPDGAFYRKHAQGEHTIWADDLYMSVPFLCRYFELTGNVSFVNDAVRQFLLYRHYLSIPGTDLMSHVYDLERGLPTQVPWGRGNGWVLFSLSELLSALPAEHADREELLGMFRTLCAAILGHQSREGLWRQVIDEPDAYLETSCTAMFIYAFARGVRNGWLEDFHLYLDSAVRAWEGLTRLSIDSRGNLHGVCQGSGYSHSSHYYKYDLHTQLNDTHGIGIVLLAGVEMLRLMDWLQTQIKEL